MEHSTSSRILEITIISGEGLKKNTFACVKTDSSNCKTTRIDKEGGSCPSWNEKLFIDLPMHVRYITVEVQCKINYSRNIKTIGIVRIPTSDFIGGFLPEDYLQFLSYRLRDEKGEKNGIINLSVKVKNSPQSGGCAAAAYSNIWKVAPVAVGNNLASGVVTGIPVYPNSYSY